MTESGTGWTYETGYLGSGADMGDGGVLTLPNFLTAVTSLPELSIGMWVYETSATSSTDLFTCRAAQGGIQAYHGASPGPIYFCADDPGGAGCSGGAFSFAAGEWHHLAVTWTNGGMVELYKDAVSVWTGDMPLAFVTPTQDFRFGDVDGSGSGFRIDDIQVWDTDFTGQQICETLMGGSWGGSSCTTT